jgi:adenylate cyclase
VTDPLATWLVEDAWRLEHPADVIAALGERALAEGLPVSRVWYGRLLLHPQLHARSWTWRPGEPIEEGRLTHAQATHPAHLTSPVMRLREGLGALRIRVQEEDPGESTMLRGMREGGATDYVALAVGARGHGVEGALSFTSHAPGGFGDEGAARLVALQPHASIVLRSMAQSELASTLLRTYLGRDAGERVLAGQIKRGDGQTLRAVVWVCDLRGFTDASEKLPRDALLALLNDWFGAMAGAVEAAGGQVLKFIGDGLLAIFPVEADPAAACAAALLASRDAASRVAALERPLRYGLSLHLGDVMYGNIGSPERLDFTVIGPAVNRAARLESLAARLGEPVVLSRAFVDAAGIPVRALGTFELKGIAEPMEAFAPV